MHVSPSEAEEALAAVELISKRTRRSIASGGIAISVIVTGCVWLLGFLGNQFLPAAYAAYNWAGLSIAGTAVAILLGSRHGRRLRSPSAGPTGRRIGFFWLLLVLFGAAAVAVAWPLDPRQITVLVVLFSMLGQLGTGLVLSFRSVWWALPIAALTLAGYYLAGDFFWLWMALLGGGGMIALGLVIRSRW